MLFTYYAQDIKQVDIFRACHGLLVWVGPGRADLKIVTGRAGRAETVEKLMGRAGLGREKIENVMGWARPQPIL